MANQRVAIPAAGNSTFANFDRRFNLGCFYLRGCLIYAEDSANPAKQLVASRLVSEKYIDGTAVISSQVLQEFYNAATSKLKLDTAFAVERLKFFSKFQIVLPTPELILSATALHRTRSLSFWDAMIVQAAITSGCDTLYSEDMQSGEIVNGVKIKNPFTA
jgi:predicted nucleic acid-binding protein